MFSKIYVFEDILIFTTLFHQHFSQIMIIAHIIHISVSFSTRLEPGDILPKTIIRFINKQSLNSLKNPTVYVFNGMILDKTILVNTLNDIDKHIVF